MLYYYLIIIDILISFVCFLAEDKLKTLSSPERERLLQRCKKFESNLPIQDQVDKIEFILTKLFLLERSLFMTPLGLA